MNLPLTPRTLTLATCLTRRTRPLNYSTPSRPPPKQAPSKVLPTVLLVGGASAAGLGGYYYNDPNAEIFKQARGYLGLEGPKQHAVEQKRTTMKPVIQEKRHQKQEPQKIPQERKVIPVPAPPPPTPVPQVAAVVATAASAAAVALPAVVPAPQVSAAAQLSQKVDDTPVGDTVPKHVLITALRAQQEALSESNEAKIKTIQIEFDRRLTNATQIIEAERVVELRGKYEKASKALEAIEQGIGARTSQNLRAKRLRALWAQVNALHARVNHPEYHDSTTTSIDKGRLITAIEVPDNFVKQMVASLPSKPVHSLESLKQRFYDELEPVAKSVTLIREGEEFSVWKYALGRMFGSAIVKVHRGEPSPSTSPVQQTANALDTARTALEKSDLLSAAIAINQLKGLSRQVASDWLADARTLLETNQTLFVLMTYAASNNVF